MTGFIDEFAEYFEKKIREKLNIESIKFSERRGVMSRGDNYDIVFTSRLYARFQVTEYETGGNVVMRLDDQIGLLDNYHYKRRIGYDYNDDLAEVMLNQLIAAFHKIIEDIDISNQIYLRDSQVLLKNGNNPAMVKKNAREYVERRMKVSKELSAALKS